MRQPDPEAARPIHAPSTTVVRAVLLAVTAVAAIGAAGCITEPPDGALDAEEAIPSGEAASPAAEEVVRTEAAPPPDDEDLDTPGAALSVLVDYYSAITRRDFAAAHALWGDEGAASGQSLEDFRESHAENELVSVEIGEPGRIEPTAGSRYVRIPVEVRTRDGEGRDRCLEGRHTLRRSVVPGATERQRLWQIESAELELCGEAPEGAEGIPPDRPPLDEDPELDAGGAVADDQESLDPAGDGAAAVAGVVERFGRRIDRVSLLAAADELREQIRVEYGPLVTAELLARWLAEPSAAPGRQTSSPSPDRIEVSDVTRRPDGDWVVRGEVVLVTSVERTAGGEAGREPVELRLTAGEGGEWRIAAFERR